MPTFGYIMPFGLLVFVNIGDIATTVFSSCVDSKPSSSSPIFDHKRNNIIANGSPNTLS
jgi:hypothetical protein